MEKKKQRQTECVVEHATKRDRRRRTADCWLIAAKRVKNEVNQRLALKSIAKQARGPQLVDSIFRFAIERLTWPWKALPRAIFPRFFNVERRNGLV